MTIKTKYNIGDNVWSVYDNKFYKGRIMRLSVVKLEGKSPCIQYGIMINQKEITRDEDSIDETKAGLMAAM